jgi:hypothetical protein
VVLVFPSLAGLGVERNPPLGQRLELVSLVHVGASKRDGRDSSVAVV